MSPSKVSWPSKLGRKENDIIHAKTNCNGEIKYMLAVSNRIQGYENTTSDKMMGCEAHREAVFEVLSNYLK